MNGYVYKFTKLPNGNHVCRVYKGEQLVYVTKGFYTSGEEAEREANISLGLRQSYIYDDDNKDGIRKLLRNSLIAMPSMLVASVLIVVLVKYLM